MKDLLKIMYIIVDKKGNAQIQSLSSKKKSCIDNYLKGSNFEWGEAKTYGWKCVKVDVNITTSSNFDSWN